MSKERNWGINRRIDEKFKKELEEISHIRMGTIDINKPKPIGIHRLQRGIIDMSDLWPEIKKRLLKMPRKEDLK